MKCPLPLLPQVCYCLLFPMKLVVPPWKKTECRTECGLMEVKEKNWSHIRVICVLRCSHTDSFLWGGGDLLCLSRSSLPTPTPFISLHGIRNPPSTWLSWCHIEPNWKSPGQAHFWQLQDRILHFASPGPEVYVQRHEVQKNMRRSQCKRLIFT